MAIEKKRFWISFDLGLSGNYTELYAWLDQKGAKECGDSVATFTSEKSRQQIKSELTRILNLKRNPRIYLISRKEGGRFIFGTRKVAPWTGFAQTSVDD